MAATLSTHVLDTARGVPASGIRIDLFAVEGEHRRHVATATTNLDGRTGAPLATGLAAGEYELVFAVRDYFERGGVSAFFTRIPVRFTITENDARYHVPLLLSPWAYSTYRGS